MNTTVSYVVLYLYTRNRNARARAGLVCRDFGLNLVTPVLYSGMLTDRERAILLERLSKLLSRKTDVVRSYGMCMMCASKNSRMGTTTC